MESERRRTNHSDRLTIRRRLPEQGCATAAFCFPWCVSSRTEVRDLLFPCSSLATRHCFGPASGSSRHQDGQFRLVKNRPCDSAEHPLACVGVAIRAHNQEIGAESGGPRKQQAAYLLAVGRYAVFPHVRPMVSQVTRD